MRRLYGSDEGWFGQNLWRVHELSIDNIIASPLAERLATSALASGQSDCPDGRPSFFNGEQY